MQFVSSRKTRRVYPGHRSQVGKRVPDICCANSGMTQTADTLPRRNVRGDELRAFGGEGAFEGGVEFFRRPRILSGHTLRF